MWWSRNLTACKLEIGSYKLVYMHLAEKLLDESGGPLQSESQPSEPCDKRQIHGQNTKKMSKKNVRKMIKSKVVMIFLTSFISWNQLMLQEVLSSRKTVTLENKQMIYPYFAFLVIMYLSSESIQHLIYKTWGSLIPTTRIKDS